MASVSPPNILQECINSGNDDDSSNGVISRREIQAAIAKTVELRALHAALMQAGNSPVKFRLPPATSPVVPRLAGQDYPVFTPTYKDEPLPAYQQILLEQSNSAQSLVEYASNLSANLDETISSDDMRMTKESLSNDLLARSTDLDQHVCPAEDQISVRGSSVNNVNVLQASPVTSYCKTRTKSMGDLNTSSCNKCKPALISIETEAASKHGKISKTVVTLTTSQQRNKGLLHLPRLFPRRKKKNENRSPSLSRTPNNEVVKDISIEALRKELEAANESKEVALTQVEETKKSLRELSQKLELLEAYCEELKNTLKQEKNTHSAPNLANFSNLPVRKSLDHGDEGKLIMIEGFLQIVLESRLSVTQFCKTLLSQVNDSDSIVDNLNSVLRPYKLSLDSKYTSLIQYHLEAIINQSFYQDFENRVFQRNGAPQILDPQQDRQARVQSFIALKNLSWGDVLRKGTRCYSEELSRFCDQKMSGIIAKLGWTKPWPEQLLQAFFDAAKGIWLLHLLAFSFNPSLGILRIDENGPFDPDYMEDVLTEGRNSEGTRTVKIMLMPGFYLHDRVVKCKVLCRCISVS